MIIGGGQFGLDVWLFERRGCRTGACLGPAAGRVLLLTLEWHLFFRGGRVRWLVSLKVDLLFSGSEVDGSILATGWVFFGEGLVYLRLRRHETYVFNKTVKIVTTPPPRMTHLSLSQSSRALDPSE